MPLPRPKPKPPPPPPPYASSSSSSCNSVPPRANARELPPREKPRAAQRKPPPPSCSPPPSTPPCPPPPNTHRRAATRGRTLERPVRTRLVNSADRRRNPWTRPLSFDALCRYAPEVPPLLTCSDGEWIFTDVHRVFWLYGGTDQLNMVFDSAVNQWRPNPTCSH